MNTDIDYKAKALEFLKAHNVAVLSTIEPDGTPHAAVITTMTDDNFNFFFITKADTTKAKNIEQNKNAALTFVDVNILTTVQVKGLVHNLENAPDYADTFLKVSEVVSKYISPPLAQLKNPGEFVLYKLEPTWLRFGDFSAKTDATQSVFQQIIPATT